ncbi:Similar to BBS7: Bardet-Biedl syndrome 7 protein (Homo sapiens) [Cotesia congregata]|uniref:Similar to BBS7: Bardet-Biedl syndrome 7 protein (Homo sapiens) n=1 Tax=Cotesia congregata TaxID=51543 RepID=A0A8J2H1E1_COTCN|nr:Similar to BBS7: Bardet-Biedl syndrome 7 protein (Homo sapiens) [Cotesia congregata]
MSLVLSRVDYVTVGVTSRRSTKILPATDSKSTQKFVVGDHDGILYIYGIKKGELQLIFKSLPGPKIEKTVLGGTIDTPKDKIFVAYGNSVKGFTKKGKMFLEFDTSLVDSISTMYVLGSDLAACSRDLYHRYQNCKDADSYLVGEIIIDVILVTIDNSSVLAILACSDRAIRVLSGTRKPTVLRLPSVPTVLALCREGERESHDRILVGTQDGKIGLLKILSDTTCRVTWIINSYGSEITSLHTYELDDNVDILVGRQDGTIEVFNFPYDDDEINPSLRYQYMAGESITSIEGGIIGTVGHTEILVTTYSGRIFGLTTRSPGSLAADSKEDTINRLKTEIQDLEAKLIEDKELENYALDNLTPLILSVNYRMIQDRETASYLLSIELDTPIDNILIQSDTPVELLNESNNAVLSFSTCNPYEGNFVLATYRCQVNTSQLETRIRSIEGQPGTLQVYVTTQIQPKCCRKIKIPIHALSLHARLHEEEQSELSGDLCNELRLVGNFTVSEIQAWLSFALPDLPERPVLQDHEVVLKYVSSLTGSILICKYKKGVATFLAENISTILILRDLLTKEATKRKIKLDVFFNIEDGTIVRMLDLIVPKFNSTYQLIEKLKIIDALQEWDLKIDSRENLSTYYQELLKEEDSMRAKLSKNPTILQIIQAVITDIYVDWNRAKGFQRITSKAASEKLKDALESRDLQMILQMFIEKNN